LRAEDSCICQVCTGNINVLIDFTKVSRQHFSLFAEMQRKIREASSNILEMIIQADFEVLSDVLKLADERA